jgi:hypothetical protein
MIRRDFITLAGTAAGLAMMSLPLRAETILLTVSGDVEGGAYTFDDEALLALPQIEFETETIWTEGLQRFSGPSLASVLEAAGAGAGDLTLRAINDYTVAMPRAVVEAEAPIVANRIGGMPFSRRDKGPLWIVFPYDADARFRSESVYAYSVWQLTDISVGG